MTFYLHDVSSHLTVLHFLSLTFLFLAHPVQRSQLLQAVLLPAGVYLVLAVHRPLISRLTVTVHEHRNCRLRVTSVPTCPASTSISTKLTINTTRCNMHTNGFNQYNAKTKEVHGSHFDKASACIAFSLWLVLTSGDLHL